MSHVCMPVKGPFGPRFSARLPPSPTPSTPAHQEHPPHRPSASIAHALPLPAFRFRLPILSVMLGATDGSYLMRGETQARIPAPGLSLHRVSFPRLTPFVFSPLPAFKLRFSNLAVILGATDVSYPMGGEAQARIPAPGLSPLRVFFPLASL